MLLIRWVLIIRGILSIAFATLFYPLFGHKIWKKYWTYFQRPHYKLPFVITDERAVRIWGVLNGVILIIFGWYLGTAGGKKLFDFVLK